MSADRQTPTDVLSGLPLPIVPDENVRLPIDNPFVADLHHGFHPASHPDLQSLGGKALRHSRLQLVDKNYHNHTERSYHRFFEGPPIPVNPDEQFKICVLAAAGFVPDQGIDLSSGDPEIVELTPSQKIQLVEVDPDDQYGRRELKYRYTPIHDFFVDYALGRDITHVKEKIIDEFVHTEHEDRAKYLGHFLIAQTAVVASDTVAEQYREVYDAGMLHPMMPSHPASLVKFKLGNDSQRVSLIPALKDRLVAQLDGSLTTSISIIPLQPVPDKITTNDLSEDFLIPRS